MRLRLILSYALIVLVSVTTVVLIVRQNTASEVRAFMFHGGMTSSSELVQSLQAYYQNYGSWEGVETILLPGGGGFGKGPGGAGNRSGTAGMGSMLNQRLRLADANGSVLVDSISLATGQASGVLSANELKDAQAIKVNFQTVGYLLVEGGMGYSNADEKNLLNRLNRAAITAALIAGSFSLLLALLLAYSLLRPVQALTQASGRLAQGDLSQRVKASGTDELAVLGRTFNHMADSLQRAQESRQALTADIAHELRTPLAVQRANLEALQDGIYPPTTENIASILDQNLLLTHLVNDLRTLALAEFGRTASGTNHC